jgi:ABC-type multidrug transport system fused ATPase/permease subunit
MFPSIKIQSLQILWQTLSPRRRRQLLALQILSLAAAAGEVANLGALLPFLRLLANPKEGISSLGPFASSLQKLPHENLLLSLGIGFIAVAFVSTTLRVITACSQLRLASLIVADLGQQVFAEVLRRPYAWQVQQNSSTVLGYLTKDVDKVSESIHSLLLVVVNLTIVVLLGGSLIALSPQTMIIVGALLACFYLLVFRFTRATLGTDGQRLTNNYQSSLQIAMEAIGGIRDVILDRSQNYFLDAYRIRQRTYRLAGASINIKAQVPRYLIEGFVVMLIVGLSLSLALAGQNIEKQIPLLGTLSLGAYRLLQPLQQCFSSISNIQANQASLKRLQPFLNPSLKQPQGHGTHFSLPVVPVDTPLVSIERLSFRYNDDGPWVLRNLDFSVYPGERLAFVGTTGSGKSTCSDLILGLLKPTEGRLFVHGLNLQQTPGLLDQWQSRVAHVPQQIYLSDASFAANIAFGVPSECIDQQRVRTAATQARIAQMIESSPQGYDTVVGERGVRLSGGQRQRIGIARALYRQAELLILDEATSALDNRTEAEVMAAIEDLNREITVLLIAHRLSTVEQCDRIVIFEQGKICGIGPYHNLATSNLAFQNLAQQRNLFS